MMNMCVCVSVQPVVDNIYNNIFMMKLTSVSRVDCLLLVNVSERCYDNFVSHQVICSSTAWPEFVTRC